MIDVRKCRIERQSDMLLSTLSAYLTALGASARLTITIKRPDYRAGPDDIRGEGTMTTQTEITQRNHHRAVRFFWCLLIGATTVSLLGDIAHATLPYLP